jgi:hypothetical protein
MRRSAVANRRVRPAPGRLDRGARGLDGEAMKFGMASAQRLGLRAARCRFRPWQPAAGARPLHAQFSSLRTLRYSRGQAAYPQSGSSRARSKALRARHHRAEVVAKERQCAQPAAAFGHVSLLTALHPFTPLLFAANSPLSPQQAAYPKAAAGLHAIQGAARSHQRPPRNPVITGKHPSVHDLPAPESRDHP